MKKVQGGRISPEGCRKQNGQSAQRKSQGMPEKQHDQENNADDGKRFQWCHISHPLSRK
jgi:hypothetical protein